MRHPRAHRRDGRSIDMRRGVEVGLPDLEVDDVASLALESLRPGEHAEGRLGAEPVERVGQPEAHRRALALSTYPSGNAPTDVQPPST